MTGQRDQPKRDAVAVKDIGTLLSRLHRLVETLAEALGLRAHDVAAEFVVLRSAGHILAHGLQRHGDHLTRQRLVDRREPVEPEPSDHGPERRTLHDQRE